MEKSVDGSVLWDISHGLYIVSSYSDGKMNGQIADALMQVSANPPKVALALNKKNLTHDFILKTGMFSVSILSEDVPMDLISHFGLRSGRDVDKFVDISFETGFLGCPIVPGFSLGCFEARLTDNVDVGTHTVFIGEVVASRKIGGGTPITYGEYKRRKKEGSSTSEQKDPPSPSPIPDSAPKIVSKEEKNMGKMDKYVCTACGYVYDPEKGDPDGGIAPGTAFEDIPDDWVCPLCGVDKTFFEKQ